MPSRVYELCAKAVARPGHLSSSVSFGYGVAVSQACGANATPGTGNGPKARIAQLTTRHGLGAPEVSRLYRVLAEWPEDVVEVGLTEELADILAARELAKLKPLTMEDVAHIRELIDSHGEPQ